MSDFEKGDRVSIMATVVGQEYDGFVLMHIDGVGDTGLYPDRVTLVERPSPVVHLRLTEAELKDILDGSSLDVADVLADFGVSDDA